ncbi:MAG: J domain-containing protein [Acidimicrobiales bacterium]|nr:J domain-containing protein [Acidimicrobiales bacterium]
MNHYDVLGVSRDVDQATLRHAYLAAARAHHPDFHVGADAIELASAAKRMQEVNEAWAVLGDPERRAEYDRTLPAPRSRPSTTSGDPSRQPLVMPPGKGWTPRPDDTRWQRNYAAWRDEDERLAEDEPSTRRRVVLVLPVLLVVLALVLGLVGAATSSRPLFAACFVAVAMAAILFVMLPVMEMARGRNRD